MSAGRVTEVDSSIVAATRAIEERLTSVLLGKEAQVRLATAALACQHLLVNDPPGQGNTTMGAALARVIGGALGRVQGTPDLLPSILTGYPVFNQATRRWTYWSGPLQANVELVDELNRIMPRTQSALLVAMAEMQVTVDGVTRPCRSAPHGTDDPAPAAQGRQGSSCPERVVPVPSADLLPDLQDYVGQIHVSDLVLDYILDLRRSLLPVAHLSARATGRWWRWPGPGHARLPALRATRRREHLAVLCLAHRLRAEGKLVDGRAAEVRAVVDGLAVPDLARS